MNIDKDLKLVGDDEEDLDAPPDPQTPEGSDGEAGGKLVVQKQGTPKQGRKRKSMGTPHKEKVAKKKAVRGRPRKVVMG